MKIKDIKASINKAIKDNAPSYPINSNDVREGYKDGSFYVTFNKAKKILQNNSLYKRELAVRIHYFPKNRENYSSECYEMQDRLEVAFGKHLKVGKRNITINETDSDIHEGILLFDFDMEFYETHEESLENDGILMQTLNLKQ